MVSCDFPLIAPLSRAKKQTNKHFGGKYQKIRWLFRGHLSHWFGIMLVPVLNPVSVTVVDVYFAPKYAPLVSPIEKERLEKSDYAKSSKNRLCWGFLPFEGQNRYVVYSCFKTFAKLSICYSLKSKASEFSINSWPKWKFQDHQEATRNSSY